MRLWLVGIVIIACCAIYLKQVGIIESNSLTSSSAPVQPSFPNVNSAQTKQVNNPILEKELGEQIAILAKHYEQNIRYPDYSIPINQGQTDLLTPLKALPVNLNLGEDVDSSAHLISERFTYKHGDTIKATLIASGPISPSQANIELVENNRTLDTFSVTSKNGDFQAKLSAKNTDWPVDLHIKASFNFGEHGRLAILAPIKYSPDNGTILSVGKAYVDGVNLSIPVNLDIRQPGRYRLSANLFNQQNTPIAHLNAKQNLTEGKNIWILQVHSEVLRSANNPGPYLLDTWVLTKLPERPGIRTSYGDSKVGKVEIKGFPLHLYDATPWHDPQNEARLQFLNKLQ